MKIYYIDAPDTPVSKARPRALVAPTAAPLTPPPQADAEALGVLHWHVEPDDAATLESIKAERGYTYEDEVDVRAGRRTPRRIGGSRGVAVAQHSVARGKVRQICRRALARRRRCA